MAFKDEKSLLLDLCLCCLIAAPFVAAYYTHWWVFFPAVAATYAVIDYLKKKGLL